MSDHSDPATFRSFRLGEQRHFLVLNNVIVYRVTFSVSWVLPFELVEDTAYGDHCLDSCP